MMKGRNNGKKLMAVRIVKHAFEIIYLLTDKNPLHVSYHQFTVLHMIHFVSWLEPRNILNKLQIAWCRYMD